MFARLLRASSASRPMVAAAAGAAAAAAAASIPAHALDSQQESAIVRAGRYDGFYREWLKEQLTEHPPALKPTEWTPLKVWSVESTSPNTKLIRFVFDDPHAVAGYDVASYLLTRAFVGKEKPDGSRGVVVRPYTPSHTTVGYLELVVKGYPEGKMSKHICSLKPGDTLDFKGPILGIPIVQNEFDSIGLIAGGSGITPMLQVAQRVLTNDNDQTKVSLIFANVSEDDILLREKIDELQAEYPQQLKVYYVRLWPRALSAEPLPSAPLCQLPRARPPPIARV
jgi:cytochrome-b5 reductase